MAHAENANKLTRETFEDPPAKYRGAPFWAWNTELSEPELLWQIDKLKEMGFGGFFMHTRSGMATPYLSDEFMNLVNTCVEHAKSVGMLSYLYDEDRWSSGAAGGLVTINKDCRQRTLCLSLKAPDEMERAYSSGNREPKLLRTFDISFDDFGRLDGYCVVDKDSDVSGEKWYLYTMLNPESGWYNGYTYLDTLNKRAVQRFIDVTYEAYKRKVGDEFGKNIPAIFTDEPHFAVIEHKAYARDGKDVSLPYTQDLDETFAMRYGCGLLDGIPEIIWNLHDDAPSAMRYRYYAHLTETFADAYSDTVGKWCAENGIGLVGHLLKEDTLSSQLSAVGEAMRHYREFAIPGIDMLCDSVELITAKQAQSVAHQCGRSGIASELYGVTGWDFDFRGHKFQGDWQAALGVTLRVPHLAWVSMHGSAKRDYPASIGYQSSWYKEYGYIERHFARINTALTRGTPCVDVAVIHPIESLWMTEGVREHTSTESAAMNERFKDLVSWLLRGQIDFDFISESMLPELYGGSVDGFNVGKMKYKAVLVPPLKTIRSTTLSSLEEFANNGGKLIVCGVTPQCVDGVLSVGACDLYSKAYKAVFTATDILNALSTERAVEIYGGNGVKRNDLIYCLRNDGDNKWLFIAHCDKPTRIDGADCVCDNVRIRVKGHYAPTYYDTVKGDIKTVSHVFENGDTVFSVPCYPLDSLLFELVPSVDAINSEAVDIPKYEECKEINIPDLVDYRCNECNVMVLDICEWSYDGERYFPREELLRIDKRVRQKYGYPLANGEDVQPYCLIGAEKPVDIWLKFTFDSAIAAPCELCYERLDHVKLNGAVLQVCDNGYFVDKSIKKMPLPSLRKGKNELIVRVPVSARISVENLFLYGKFGVRACGSHAEITEQNKKIAFGSIVHQGMPFYGGEITYRIPFECARGKLTVKANYYIGALIGVRLDGRDVGKIVLPPYGIDIPDVCDGKHIIELTLYASRINTFGALHLCVPVSWKGPNMWYTDESGWAYEYQLHEVGIMKKPTFFHQSYKTLKKDSK